jgi:hypothetical protein
MTSTLDAVACQKNPGKWVIKFICLIVCKKIFTFSLREGLVGHTIREVEKITKNMK